MNFPSNFPELRPPSKDKEIPASLTDPQIRGSRAPDPQAIMAMAKISTQTNYQSKIGNPAAMTGPFGIGAINPMMSPNAGREVLNTPSPVPDKSLGLLAKEVAKKGVTKLLIAGGLIAKGASSLSPVGVAANLLSTTQQLNAGEEDWIQSRSKSFYTASPAEQARMEEQWRQQALYEQAERKTQDEIWQRQNRERNERWSSMKADELNKKLQTSDDHITHYFSRRAIK
jgi:hypothetical protein